MVRSPTGSNFAIIKRLMATRYEELQGDAALAFQTYEDHRKNAAQILNSVASALISKKGFPQENVGFVRTGQSGEEDRSRRFAEQVIDRDETGAWNAALCVRVESPGGGHLITYLFLEVHFTGKETQLEMLEDGGGSVSVNFQSQERDAQFESLMERVTSKIAETNDWLRTGVGKKRSIGFRENAD